MVKEQTEQFSEQDSPIIVVRVCEHVLLKNLSFTQILKHKQIMLQDRAFILAGCTLHKYNHYCAIISSERHGDLWYDGLVGFLQPMPEDICSWSQSHAIYCAVSCI